MIGLTIVAYVIALRAPESIFAIATQYAFTGYAALAPLLVAALFWRGSTKWGALASTLWVAFGVIGIAAVNASVPAPPPGHATPVLVARGHDRDRANGGRAERPRLDAGRADGAGVVAAARRRLGAHAPAERGTIARYFPG